nr:hypothetical protein L203_03857 [Cryptococcus depauperatus CBS 7841]
MIRESISSATDLFFFTIALVFISLKTPHSQVYHCTCECKCGRRKHVPSTYTLEEDGAKEESIIQESKETAFTLKKQSNNPAPGKAKVQHGKQDLLTQPESIETIQQEENYESIESSTFARCVSLQTAVQSANIRTTKPSAVRTVEENECKTAFAENTPGEPVSTNNAGNIEATVKPQDGQEDWNNNNVQAQSDPGTSLQQQAQPLLQTQPLSRLQPPSHSLREKSQFEQSVSSFNGRPLPPHQVRSSDDTSDQNYDLRSSLTEGSSFITRYTKVDSLLCRPCNKQFRSHSALQQHNRAVHPASMISEGVESTNGWASPSKMSKHISQFTASNTYLKCSSQDGQDTALACEICNEAIQSLYELRQHKKEKHPWSLICPDCLVTFNHVTDSRSHYEAVHACEPTGFQLTPHMLDLIQTKKAPNTSKILLSNHNIQSIELSKPTASNQHMASLPVQTFLILASYDSHMVQFQHHCPQCEAIFKDPSEFAAHANSYHSQGDKHLILSKDSTFNSEFQTTMFSPNQPKSCTVLPLVTTSVRTSCSSSSDFAALPSIHHTEATADPQDMSLCDMSLTDMSLCDESSTESEIKCLQPKHEQYALEDPFNRSSPIAIAIKAKNGVAQEEESSVHESIAAEEQTSGEYKDLHEHVNTATDPADDVENCTSQSQIRQNCILAEPPYSAFNEKPPYRRDSVVDTTELVSSCRKTFSKLPVPLPPQSKAAKKALARQIYKTAPRLPRQSKKSRSKKTQAYDSDDENDFELPSDCEMLLGDVSDFGISVSLVPDKDKVEGAKNPKDKIKDAMDTNRALPKNLHQIQGEKIDFPFYRIPDNGDEENSSTSLNQISTSKDQRGVKGEANEEVTKEVKRVATQDSLVPEFHEEVIEIRRTPRGFDFDDDCSDYEGYLQNPENNVLSDSKEQHFMSDTLLSPSGAEDVTNNSGDRPRAITCEGAESVDSDSIPVEKASITLTEPETEGKVSSVKIPSHTNILPLSSSKLASNTHIETINHQFTNHKSSTFSPVPVTVELTTADTSNGYRSLEQPDNIRSASPVAIESKQTPVPEGCVHATGFNSAGLLESRLPPVTTAQSTSLSLNEDNMYRPSINNDQHVVTRPKGISPYERAVIKYGLANSPNDFDDDTYSAGVEFELGREVTQSHERNEIHERLPNYESEEDDEYDEVEERIRAQAIADAKAENEAAGAWMNEEQDDDDDLGSRNYLQSALIDPTAIPVDHLQELLQDDAAVVDEQLAAKREDDHGQKIIKQDQNESQTPNEKQNQHQNQNKELVAEDIDQHHTVSSNESQISDNYCDRDNSPSLSYLKDTWAAAQTMIETKATWFDETEEPAVMGGIELTVPSFAFLNSESNNTVTNTPSLSSSANSDYEEKTIVDIKAIEPETPLDSSKQDDHWAESEEVYRIALANRARPPPRNIGSLRDSYEEERISAPQHIRPNKPSRASSSNSYDLSNKDIDDSSHAYSRRLKKFSSIPNGKRSTNYGAESTGEMEREGRAGILSIKSSNFHDTDESGWSSMEPRNDGYGSSWDDGGSYIGYGDNRYISDNKRSGRTKGQRQRLGLFSKTVNSPDNEVWGALPTVTDTAETGGW